MLKGKNCLITGATGGIGSCIARKMAEEGCNLYLTSTNNDGKLKTLVATLHDTYEDKIRGTKCDLNNVESIETLIQMVEIYSPIDILINCAGIDKVKSLLDSTLDDYETTMNVNVRAAFLFSKAFVPNMIEQQWGRIVNIASAFAYEGHGNTPLYCSSKHALLGLSRSLYDDLKKHNIRVFCISPGTTKTSMRDHINRKEADTFIKPEEIAEYIVQIISFDSTMISEEVRLNRMVIPGN